MTIAMVYMSPEGVVLGADSTASSMIAAGRGQIGYHYLNHNQKIFEIGEKGTMAALTWGLGGFHSLSYRTMFAELADDLAASPPASVQDVMNRWIVKFWAQYTTALSQFIGQLKALSAKPPFDPKANPKNPLSRTEEEENEFQVVHRTLVTGFVIGGYCLPNRTPTALQVIFDPLQTAPPNPAVIPVGHYGFWGAPNMIQRLILGCDDNLKQSILDCGKWNGTPGDLSTLLDQHRLAHPILPIRDAIDFVHSCIYSTIKAMKFSNLFQICGGPIELAVITSDRQFRWVHHKKWSAAIVEGQHGHDED